MSQTIVELACRRCEMVVATGQQDGDVVKQIKLAEKVDDRLLLNGMRLEVFQKANVVHPVDGVKDEHTIA